MTGNEKLKSPKTYCVNCDELVAYRTMEVERRETIKGHEICFPYMQVVCEECGEEVYIARFMDQNTAAGHDAYRKAIGVITTREIQAILDQYNIGAVPLSTLLGWGQSTVHKQLTGTIPSKEKSDVLRKLADPLEMKRLVERNRELLTPLTLERVEKALDSLLNVKSAMMAIEIPDALYQWVVQEAKASGTSISDMLTMLLSMGLGEKRVKREIRERQEALIMEKMLQGAKDAIYREPSVNKETWLQSSERGEGFFQ